MIGIIDYGAGNIRSISRGLVAAGADVVVSDNADEIAAADAIVLPGVGHAGQLIGSLERLGMDKAIAASTAAGKPYLGICVGLQIMFEAQEEGNKHGLGLLPGRVTHLPRGLKTPHIGWSEVETVRESPAAPAGQNDYFYFVHSYAADGVDEADVVATTTYGRTFPSVVIRDHIWGSQFHPEKSSAAGIEFLRSFADYVTSRARFVAGAATR
jgi:glutamine amidotransferase